MTGVEENISPPPTAYQDPQQRLDGQPAPSSISFSSNPESDPNSRYPSSNTSYVQHQQQSQVQQPIQPYSRPSSGLSGSGHHAYYEDQQRERQQDGAGRAQSSVVIKVGMVGDAQIGKTSLMVKYVEGSWDEDYIQTLG